MDGLMTLLQACRLGIRSCTYLLYMLDWQCLVSLFVSPSCNLSTITQPAVSNHSISLPYLAYLNYLGTFRIIGSSQAI